MGTRSVSFPPFGLRDGPSGASVDHQGRDATRVVGVKDHYSPIDAKRLQKSQYTAAEYKARMDLEQGYSPERMLEMFRERAKYLIERGSTLNNPHIPADFFSNWTSITNDHAVVLRDKVRA